MTSVIIKMHDLSAAPGKFVRSQSEAAATVTPRPVTAGRGCCSHLQNRKGDR